MAGAERCDGGGGIVSALDRELIVAYHRGKTAYRCGAGTDRCPEGRGPVREAWLRGWRVAKLIERAEQVVRKHLAEATP